MIARKLAHAEAQKGVALIALLALFAFVLVGVLLTTATGTADAIERDKKTFASLAIAKRALIDFAAGGPIDFATPNRPGDLPCPDLNNDGQAEGICNAPA
ncbi:MAG: hypothetical protein ABI612_08950, partial [Betaproteobacteria bacterium]